MGEIGIGIGIDRDAIVRLMKDLAIKPDRIDDLHEILTDAMENATGNPADDINRFLAKTNKANEVAFLCFVNGLLHGTHGTISQVTDKLGDVIKSAVIQGAEHADEIKEMIRNNEISMPENLPMATATDPATVKKKPDQKPDEDRMYG